MRIFFKCISSATCRRPIRGAAGRPLSETWLDESRLRLTEFRETSSSSYTETRSVPRMSAVPLAASRPAAPPAVKTRARRSLPVWVQLVLLSALAGFLFFVYQAMETNEVGLFKQSGAVDSTSKWTSCGSTMSLPSLSYSASTSLCWFSSRGLLPAIFIYSYKDRNSQILHYFHALFEMNWFRGMNPGFNFKNHVFLFYFAFVCLSCLCVFLFFY